jgi:hypothetical protein
MNKNTFLSLLAITFSIYAQAQTPAKSFGPEGTTRCSSNDYEEYIRTIDPTIESRTGLNNLVQRLVSEQLNASSEDNQINGTNNILTIPVVVHVIHNGDA